MDLLTVAGPPSDKSITRGVGEGPVTPVLFLAHQASISTI
jgi:hypothetical protein